MSENAFEKIKDRLLARLNGLSPKLTYHSISHTIDVIEQSKRIALEEGIRDERDLFLLNVAALYHDCGFLETYSEHEKRGCDIFLADPVNTEFTDAEKNIIRGLIMATRIPQRPETLMEKILCDADLDYLGRHDFFTIGESLRREFLSFKIVANDEEWEKLQLSFLQSHRYHTNASQQRREPLKQLNYSKLIEGNASR